jgi:hypothetical protein
VRPLPQLETVGASDDFVFTPDDEAVVVQENTGRLVRIGLADGARQPLPSTRSDQTLPLRSTCRTVRMSSFMSAQSDQPAT